MKPNFNIKKIFILGDSAFFGFQKIKVRNAIIFSIANDMIQTLNNSLLLKKSIGLGPTWMNQLDPRRMGTSCCNADTEPVKNKIEN
jgi:hypothetical protein